MIKGIFLFYKKLARKFLSPASPHVAAHIPATQACLQVQLGGSGLLGHPALSKPLRCHLTTWVGWKLPLGTAEAHSIFLGPGSSPPALGPIALQHPLSRLHWSPDWQKHAWMQQRGDKLCELTSLLQLWKSNGEKIKKNETSAIELNTIWVDLHVPGGTSGKPTPRGLLSIIWWSTPMEKAAGGGISLIFSVIHSPRISDSWFIPWNIQLQPTIIVPHDGKKPLLSMKWSTLPRKQKKTSYTNE